MKPSEVFTKWMVKALTGAQKHSASIWAATLSTVDFMLRNMGCYVHDISRIKEATIKGIEAETDKKVLEAAEKANKITLSQRNQEIEKIERLAEAQKTIAKAKKIGAETETIEVKNEILKQVSQATTVVDQARDKCEKSTARLSDALKQLEKEGGAIYGDSELFNEIIRSGLPAGLDHEEDGDIRES